MSNDNQEIDDVFGEETPVLETTKEATPVEDKVSTEVEVVEEETKVIEAISFKNVNPNVKESQNPLRDIDVKASPWKYQLPLAAFNHTPKETEDLTKNSYYMREDASYDDKWAAAVNMAQEDAVAASFFGASLKRKDSDWGVKVHHEGQRLGAGRPKVTASHDGSKIVGLQAVSKIQELLGLGGMIKVPLWHSGIYVSIKTPTDIQLLNFYETIGREKIELGKNTAGLIFSNSSSYVNSALYDLAIDCIYESSVKDCTIPELKDLILMNDFAIIAWALAYTLFPNGYSYIRPCIVDPKKCQHTVEALLDIGKLLWVDRSAINEKQRRHMSLIPRQQVTVDQVKAYQNEFVAAENNIYDTGAGIKIVFKQPTLTEHLENGLRWIEELDGVVRDVFADEVKNDVLNRYIGERASLTRLRNYGHYVKSVVYTDDNSSSDDADTLERILSQLSTSPDIVEGLVTKLNEFIDGSSIALVAINRAKCPKCDKEPQEDIDTHPFLIPLNPVRLFFRLRDRKLQQSIPS